MEETIQTPESQNEDILVLLEKIRHLLQYNKDREEAVVSLGKIVEQYRGDFVITSFKPFVLSLIDYRESAKKDLASIDKYPLNAEKVGRNIEFLLEELDQLLDNNGIEVKDDHLFYCGHDVSEPLKAEPEPEPEPEPAPEEPQEEAAPEEEAPVEEAPEKDLCEEEGICPISHEEPQETPEPVLGNIAEEVVEEVKEPCLEELIRSICRDIEAMLKVKSPLEASYKQLVEASKARDQENRWVYIYPALRDISGLRDHISHAGKALPEDDEGAKEEYKALLSHVIDGCAYALEKLGGRIVITDDVLNSSQHRLVRPVPTDDPSLDRAIANKMTDCYALGDKVVYLQKVEVYKSR